ncbi:ROK family protein [bacterium]|nr:ROK family protein [bacterium]
MIAEKLALAIDVGGTSIKWGVVSSDGNLLEQGSIPVRDRSQQGIVDLITAQLLSLIERHKDRVTAIGVGAPGLYDRERTLIHESPNYPLWNDFPLKAMLTENLPSLPLSIENDANLLVFSETTWGAAVGEEDVIVLTLGTGVGGGILTSGKLVTGSHGSGGEVGHIIINPDGPKCGCGSRGCLEAYCNIKGVLRAIDEHYRGQAAPQSPEELSHAARNEDKQALKTFDYLGAKLGAGICSLANLFNPSAILVGGGIGDSGELILTPARKFVESHVMAANLAGLRIEQAKFRSASGIMGAAALAFKHSEGIGTNTPFESR